MSDAADLAHQLAAEDRTQARQYVLSGTRGRWKVLGLGIVLLTAIKLAGLVTLTGSFIVGFGVVFAVVNYAMTRVARSGALPPWCAHHPLGAGAGTRFPTAQPPRA